MTKIESREAEAGPPRWLLWSVGAAAATLSIAAFLLWGFSGAAYVFDLVIAYCT